MFARLGHSEVIEICDFRQPLSRESLTTTDKMSIADKMCLPREREREREREIERDVMFNAVQTAMVLFTARAN